MKKIIFILSLFIATAQTSFGQCTPGTYNITCTANYNTTTLCTPANFTVTGSSSFLRCDSDPAGWTFCPSTTLQISLQFWTGSTWSTITSQNISNGGSYSLTTSPTVTRNYRIRSSVVTTGSYCATGGSTSFTTTSTTVVANTPPLTTFKVNNASVNSTTHLQTYECQNINITDITWSGSNSVNIPGVTPAATYQYNLFITKLGSPIFVGSNWQPGTPPTTLALKSTISSFWGASNLSGLYTVTLFVRNFCNTSSYQGLVQINQTPNVSSSCFQLSSTNSCSVFVNPGTQSFPVNVCALSPKMNTACVGGQFIRGYYNLIVDEFTTSNVFVKNVVNSGNIFLNNTNDISCLDINVLSSPVAYFFTNPAARKYRVTWEVGNLACNPNPPSKTIGWFVDNIGGCKTDGEDLTTGIDDESPSDDALVVYPNPSIGLLNITWLHQSEKEPTIKIYSIDGKENLVQPLMSSKGSATIDISNLAKGIYFVEVENGTKNVKKVILN